MKIVNLAVGAVMTCSVLQAAAQNADSSIPISYRFERFNNSSPDGSLTEKAMRDLVANTLSAHGVRFRETGLMLKGRSVQFEADTLYIPNGTDTRVVVFRPRLMSNGAEVCGITSNAWGTGASSGQRMRSSIKEAVAYFVKRCLSR